MRRGAAVTGVGLLVAAVLAGCGSSRSPHLTFGPASALYDTPLTATVDGVDSGAGVTLTMTTQDAKGVTWTSSATYSADSRGQVTLDSAATGGAYTGVDPSGLLDALYPTSGGVAPISMSPPAAWSLTLTARVGGHDVGTDTVRRLLTSDVGVTTTTLTLAADGLVGVMAEPADTSKRGPAVVVWGGSEGGLTVVNYAKLLAAHGYPALALAYFGEPGLPSTLTNIPMEYFAKAVTYLDGRPGVDPAKVAVSGASRGSEAAELLGVERPDLVHAVIGLSPGGVVYGNFPSTGAPAWTYGGQPVPYAPTAEYGNAHPATTDAIIPVAQIRGPLLLVCGGKDTEWPSCDYVTAMTALRESDPPTVVRVADAGHHVCILPPGLPVPDQTPAGDEIEEGGGTAVVNGAGRIEAWPRLLAFVAAVP